MTNIYIEIFFQLLRTEYEEKLRKAEEAAFEANNAKKIAEDSAKLRYLIFYLYYFEFSKQDFI